MTKTKLKHLASRAADSAVAIIALVVLAPVVCFLAIATLGGAFKPGGIHLAERQEEDFYQAEADRLYAESLRDMADA